MLVGNKTDLHKLREVKKEEAAEYAEKKQIAFIETSALISQNVDQAFEQIIKCILILITFDRNPSSCKPQTDSLRVRRVSQ